jgi:hypothetical protein
MVVKASTGAIIRNYYFSPPNLFSSSGEDFPSSTVTSLKYVGPKDVSSFFNHLIFFTLETIFVGTKFINGTSVKFSNKCIVRRWELNTALSTLELRSTITKESSSIDEFNVKAFSVKQHDLEFESSTTTGTEEIDVSFAEILAVGDLLQLGPSTDNDNFGAIESVYVHSVSGNTVYIRSFDGTTPTLFEYVVGDPITFIGDIFLFSDAKIEEHGQEDRYTGEAFLYTIGNRYGDIVNKDASTKYNEVRSAVWNDSTGGLSYIKTCNYMTVDVVGYENVKSQRIRTIDKSGDTIEVFAIDCTGTDLFFLQSKCLRYSDSGDEITVTWDSYNYVQDTIIPYSFSASLLSNRDILLSYDQTTVVVKIKDQFNNGVLGANIFFSYSGDINGSIQPQSGYAVSDVNGEAVFIFTSGNIYGGLIEFTARAGNGSTNSGSQYVVGRQSIVEITDCVSEISISQVDLRPFNISVIHTGTVGSDIHLSEVGKYIFGLGTATTEIAPYGFEARHIHTAMIVQKYEPIMLIDNKSYINIDQGKIVNSEIHISSFEHESDNFDVNQMTASRHLIGLNEDTALINQYVFIQDAIPKFYEDKVNVNTSVWIRMRPFAYALDPGSLLFEIREVNDQIGIDTGFYNVTYDGVISLFDAGGGMYGIDFFYQPQDFFHNESVIYVRIKVSDFSPFPNTMNILYWFIIIDDYKGPVVFNISPPKNSTVPINTPTSFSIKDLGIGVNIDDVLLFVNDSSASYSYTQEMDVYNIEYLDTSAQKYGSSISFNVVATDKSKHKNTSYAYWSIYISDSTGPLVDTDNSSPHKCSEDVRVNHSNISMQMYAIDNTGIDEESISIFIDGLNRTDSMNLLPVVYRIVN